MNKTSNQDMLVKITTKGIWKFSIHKNALKSYFFLKTIKQNLFADATWLGIFYI